MDSNNQLKQDSNFIKQAASDVKRCEQLQQYLVLQNKGYWRDRMLEANLTGKEQFYAQVQLMLADTEGEPQMLLNRDINEVKGTSIDLFPAMVDGEAWLKQYFPEWRNWDINSLLKMYDDEIDKTHEGDHGLVAQVAGCILKRLIELSSNSESDVASFYLKLGRLYENRSWAFDLDKGQMFLKAVACMEKANTEEAYIALGDYYADMCDWTEYRFQSRQRNFTNNECFLKAEEYYKKAGECPEAYARLGGLFDNRKHKESVSGLDLSDAISYARFFYEKALSLLSGSLSGKKENELLAITQKALVRLYKYYINGECAGVGLKKEEAAKKSISLLEDIIDRECLGSSGAFHPGMLLGFYNKYSTKIPWDRVKVVLLLMGNNSMANKPYINEIASIVECLRAHLEEGEVTKEQALEVMACAKQASDAMKSEMFMMINNTANNKDSQAINDAALCVIGENRESLYLSAIVHSVKSVRADMRPTFCDSLNCVSKFLTGMQAINNFKDVFESKDFEYQKYIVDAMCTYIEYYMIDLKCLISPMMQVSLKGLVELIKEKPEFTIQADFIRVCIDLCNNETAQKPSKKSPTGVYRYMSEAEGLKKLEKNLEELGEAYNKGYMPAGIVKLAYWLFNLPNDLPNEHNIFLDFILNIADKCDLKNEMVGTMVRLYLEKKLSNGVQVIQNGVQVIQDKNLKMENTLLFLKLRKVAARLYPDVLDKIEESGLNKALVAANAIDDRTKSLDDRVAIMQSFLEYVEKDGAEQDIDTIIGTGPEEIAYCGKAFYELAIECMGDSKKVHMEFAYGLLWYVPVASGYYFRANQIRLEGVLRMYEADAQQQAVVLH